MKGKPFSEKTTKQIDKVLKMGERLRQHTSPTRFVPTELKIRPPNIKIMAKKEYDKLFDLLGKLYTDLVYNAGMWEHKRVELVNIIDDMFKILEKYKEKEGIK
jgi:hypothetical protein